MVALISAPPRRDGGWHGAARLVCALASLDGEPKAQDQRPRTAQGAGRRRCGHPALGDAVMDAVLSSPDTGVSSPDTGVDGVAGCKATAPLAFSVEWELPSQDETTAREGAMPLRHVDPRQLRRNLEWPPVDRGGAE